MNPSPTNLSILGFDPGQDKCGLAIIHADGQPRHRQVVAASEVMEIVQQLARTYGFDVVVLGNQTRSQHWQQQLRQAMPHCSIILVDERNSSREARQRYWDFYPPRGWNRILPKGLRVPPGPYDDIVAQILVERYLDGGYGV